MSLRRLGGDRAGEIGLNRFFHNEAVTSEEMLRTAAMRTAERCRGVAHVLAIQDTTVLRGEKTGGGLYLHAAIAVDAGDGTLLGPVHGTFLSRTGGERSKKRVRTVDAKESGRWLIGADKTAEVCAAADRITVVADREADIYETFARRPQRVDLLIRAAQDRALEDGGSSFATVDGLPELARRDLDVSAAPARPARKAKMVLRLARLKLKHPRNGKRSEGSPDSVEITLVDVREAETPTGQKPLHWRLLTTHPAVTAEQGWAIADLYRRRWHIEQVFRTFKSEGFDIERARVEDDLVREKLAAVCFIAAVAVQQMVHARDGAPHGVALRPIEDAFRLEDIPLIEAFCTQLEGKTERQKNPHPRGTLAYAAWVCARLGGWTGYYGKPGPIVMLRGWRDIQAAKHGWTLALINQPFGNV